MKDQDFWSMKPLILTIDGAAVLSRRILQRMIAAEARSRPSPMPSSPDSEGAG
jgi:hypothetical protein